MITESVIMFIIDEIVKLKEEGKRINKNKLIDLVKDEFNLDITLEELNDVIGLDDNIAKEPKKKKKTGASERKPKVTDAGDYYIVSAYKQVGMDYKEVVYNITKDELREIKKMYCTSPHFSINQMCMHFNMTREKFFHIKTAFSITQNDVSVIDDDLINGDYDSLADETIEAKKLKYMKRLEQKELKYYKNLVEKMMTAEYKTEAMIKATTQALNDVDFSKSIIIPKEFTITNNEKMLEVPIFDLHLGKLAWSGESYFNNYDHKIASERFMFAIEEAIRIARKLYNNYGQILFPVGSDFFNFDNRTGTTEKGTPQTNDLRYEKMFTLGEELYIRGITKLLELGPVKAFLVAGNHDATTSFHVARVLEYAFKGDSRVTIDSSPQPRKYLQFGKSLIGFAHGDKEKSRIQHNMQDEVPGMWGDTYFHEWHLGHYHSENLKTHGNLKVRRLSSLTDPDAFHSSSGYVGAIAQTEIFIWDKENGQEHMFPVKIMR